MSKFGQYQLLERVAVGGMGEVYRARSLGEEGFEKPVAIKRILPSYASDVRFVEMLVTEARIHAALSHRNIVQIHDLGISEDHEYFIVLEFVDGHDLGALLTRLAERRLRGIGPSRVPDAVALYIAIELGEGLHYAHEMRDENGEPLGLIHRDISPSNVLLSYAGEVKLSDFGLAKRRTDHSIVGSLKGQLAYMSPEQARRAPLDRRTDVFSLGGVLFEMLTGQPLRTIADDISGWQLVASGAVPAARQYRPEILPALEQLLEGALAPDPRDRFPDARAFVAEARGALDLLPRSRAGEAGELTALLRGLLPPGRPRPAKAQSKVIRLLSELAVPPPPPPPPPRKRESGLSRLSPPPAAAPGMVSSPAPALRDGPAGREESRPSRSAPPGPPGAEQDGHRAGMVAPPTESSRSGDQWPALLDLVAPPIGSPGSQPTPPPPTFRPPPQRGPVAAYPEGPVGLDDSDSLSSLEEIEGLEAPPPQRAPLPNMAPVPQRLPMPPLQPAPQRMPLPQREAPPQPQMSPVPQRMTVRETPPQPQMAPVPQRMTVRETPPQPQMAPQRMPPPQRESVPPPMAPMPQRAPIPPREPPPTPHHLQPQMMPPQHVQPQMMPPQMPPQMMQPQMMPPEMMMPPQHMQPQMMPPQMMEEQELADGQEMLEEMPEYEMEQMPPGANGMAAWDGQQMQEGEEQEGEEQEEEAGQSWTYADQPQGMPEGTPYVVEGGYPMAPPGTAGSRARRLQVAGILVAVLGVAVAAVHFAIVPLNVLAVWRQPARLEVDSTPAGAEVYIDGRRLSARTPTFTDVTRDTVPHIIEVRLEGFRSETQRMFYSKSVKLEVSMRLTGAANPDIEMSTPAPPPRARRAPDPTRTPSP
jgi:serine/threonine protein kinase